MRILHTADWHLGARLGNQDRLNDLLARLDELCDYMDQEEVDLLLVAGDVFDEHRADVLARIVAQLGRLLAPRIEAGLVCAFIAGNHDREHVFPLLRGIQELVGPEARGQVVFTERPQLVSIGGRGGEAINLVLLPYPTPIRYGLADRRWSTPDRKRADLADSVRRSMEDLVARARDEGRRLPTVLCGHFLIRGIKEGLYHLTEQNDVLLEPGDIPAYSYAALGHVRKAQAVGAPNVRYAGSIDRMDRSEAGDRKRALLVEVGRDGLHAVRELPLNATPFAHVQASSMEDPEEAAQSLLEPERTLVSLTFALRRCQPLGALQARARQLFPWLYGLAEVRWVDEPPRAGPRPQVNLRDVPGTVSAYLREKLRDDPDRHELLALADEMMGAGGGPRVFPTHLRAFLQWLCLPGSS